MIDETHLSPMKETKIRVMDALVAEDVLASEETKGTLEDQRQADNMVVFVIEVTETLEPGSLVGSEEMMAFTAKTKGAGSSEVKWSPAGKVTMRDALNGKEKFLQESLDKL